MRILYQPTTILLRKHENIKKHFDQVIILPTETFGVARYLWLFAKYFEGNFFKY